MSFGSPSLTGQFDSVCPRRLRWLVALNTANKQDDVIIDFYLIVFILGDQTPLETDIRTDGFVVEAGVRAETEPAGRWMFSGFRQKERNWNRNRLWHFHGVWIFSRDVSSAKEMETKLNQGQTEKICETNHEYFFFFRQSSREASGFWRRAAFCMKSICMCHLCWQYLP